VVAARPSLSLLTCFTTRHDGSLRSTDHENRAGLYARLGITADRVVNAEQVHGGEVARVTSADGGRTVPGVDALIADDPDLMLMLQFADCVPVLVHDPRHDAIGAAHAGWKGTAVAIAATTVDAMRIHLGSDPGELRAWIGPAIGQCCYEVSDEVAGAVEAATPGASLTYPSERGRPMLDLQAANRAQLLAAGLRPENLHWRVTCTACQVDTYFSHRGENGQAGRIAALIGLRTGAPA
jgi:YfiH family protein